MQYRPWHLPLLLDHTNTLRMSFPRSRYLPVLNLARFVSHLSIVPSDLLRCADSILLVSHTY